MDAAAHQTPLGDRICNASVQGFALFTLLVNLAAFFGLGLDTLVAVVLCALLMLLLKSAAGAFSAGHRRPGSAAARAATDAGLGSPPCDPGPAQARTPRVAAVGLGAVAVTIYWATGALAAYWGVALAAALMFLSLEIKTPVVAAKHTTSRGAESTLFLLCLLCAVVTAVAHRGDADDAFYVNLAVAAVDHPNAPLLAWDTLHGYAEVPMSMPVFKVLSIEMLEAIVAKLSGWSALSVAHLLIPPLLAFLMPLAYARVLRLLMPRQWLYGVVCVIAFLMFVGDGGLSHGSFAFLRMQQGKSMLLHVGIPLVLSYGLEFALAPTRRAWAMLAASQIASVGLSTTALWIAPAAAGVAVASGVSLLGAGGLALPLRSLALGLLSSFHPLGLALGLRSETERMFREAVHQMESLSYSSPQLMNLSLESVVGSGVNQKFVLFALVAALGFAGSPLLRRFCAVSLLAFLALFWSPFSSNFIASHVSGPDTFFRVFWLLPVPISIAAVITAPLHLPNPLNAKEVLPSWAGAAATGLLAIVFFGLTPSLHTLSAANGVRIAAPAWKVPPLPFEAAQQIAAHAAPGDRVLAPGSAARWLPLLHHPPYPLVVRDIHIDLLQKLLGGTEVRHRMRLSKIVGGEVKPEDKDELLAEAIDRYELAVVCLGGQAMSWASLRKVLLDSPLEVRFRSSEYEVWARAGPEPAAGPQR